MSGNERELGRRQFLKESTTAAVALTAGLQTLPVRAAKNNSARDTKMIVLGFDAKVAIHPTQVAVIRDAYAPTAEQLDWARRVLDTARGERGVFQFEGIMVDAPVLRRAERIVGLAPHPGA